MNIIMYRNTMTGEVGNYNYWKSWAEKFYASLAYDEMGRDTTIVQHIDVRMPKDWWKRVQKVLKLEKI